MSKHRRADVSYATAERPVGTFSRSADLPHFLQGNSPSWPAGALMTAAAGLVLPGFGGGGVWRRRRRRQLGEMDDPGQQQLIPRNVLLAFHERDAGCSSACIVIIIVVAALERPTSCFPSADPSHFLLSSSLCGSVRW
ncbi:hypothetical protein EYF80_033265 [Liparis tanakae]|uniref:Uncharacterized protein n=1 Tax=Liparis tanakae TaxID=230148 RepID=A0A4Z2GT20_9TELE|nr:hypothetical protein EYF80_033265 [Liparis tanakae]